MDGTAVRPNTYTGPSRARITPILLMAAVVSALLVLVAVTSPLRASAAIVATVNLRTAESYSILAGEAITNVPTSSVDGDVGVSPGTAVGLTEAEVEGEIHSADGAALQAKADLVTAYDNVAGRPVNQDLAVELGGLRLIGGVYKLTTDAQITGTLTLDGQNNPNSVFIFQVPRALGAQANSTVSLVNGASSCNVFWQVGSSATIGVGSAFVGTVMALTSIAVETDATVAGRALARNGEVTLDSNVFTSNECEVGPNEAPPVTVTPTITAPPVSVTPTVTASPPVTVTPTVTGPPVTQTPTVTASPPVTVTPTVTASSTITVGPTDTDTENATEAPTATATDTSATATGAATDSEYGTENAAAISTSTTETLASTGSSGMTSFVGAGGVLIVLLGGALLAIARIRSRPKRRH